MATTKTPEVSVDPTASEMVPLREAEHDKLGPLGTKPSALHDPAELRATLLGAFVAAVHDAREAASVEETSTATAVHDARKALRRARAVLSMVAGALPKSERKAVRTALQEARRSLSTVRDHAVAPESFRQLTLNENDRDTAMRILDNAAAAVPAASEIHQLLSDAASRAAEQAAALQAALPPEIEWSVVASGIADVYGEARRAHRDAKRSKQWFHTWRRRSKELSYQLGFLEKLAGPRTAAIRGEVDTVNETIGPAVDLIMLREFVETHDQGIPAAEVRHLRDSLDSTLDELMKSSRKHASDAFQQKPTKFERRLTKAVRRDLTPADDSPPQDGDSGLAGD